MPAAVQGVHGWMQFRLARADYRLTSRDAIALWSLVPLFDQANISFALLLARACVSV